jgi:DNA/RNA endonuclease YhcR with UshA esterase domain
MQEKTLFKIAISCAIIGMFILFILSEELSLAPIESLESAQIEKTIKIQGVATKVTKKDTVTFLEVSGEQTTTMQIIIFPKEEIFLKEGMNVEIEGIVEEYKGKKEIIASSVIAK